MDRRAFAKLVGAAAVAAVIPFSFTAVNEHYAAARRLGVVKTEAEFERLSATSAKLARVLKKDREETLGELIAALERSSPRPIGRPGIVVSWTATYQAEADRRGKDPRDLTYEEKRQALLREALAASARAVNC